MSGKRKRSTRRKGNHSRVAPPTTIQTSDMDAEMRMTEVAMKIAGIYGRGMWTR